MADAHTHEVPATLAPLKQRSLLMHDIRSSENIKLFWNVKQPYDKGINLNIVFGLTAIITE
jgi:hypothetical protein